MGLLTLVEVKRLGLLAYAVPVADIEARQTIGEIALILCLPYEVVREAVMPLVARLGVRDGLARAKENALAARPLTG